MTARFLALYITLIGTAAYASTPTGKQFGHWHVTSISSLSGTEGDDASVSLVQEHGCSIEGYGCSGVEARWVQGSDVIISADIDSCRGEDDFFRSFSVPAERWVQDRDAAEKRVVANFRTWLKIAKARCAPARVRPFNMSEITPAVREFSNRLTYWSR